MSCLELVRGLLGEYLPIRYGHRGLALASNDPGVAVQEEDGIVASLELTSYDTGDICGMRVLLVDPDFARRGPERVAAFLEGWLLAVPTLLDRARDLAPRPIDVICPPAQHDPEARTASEYRDLILRPDGPMRDWRNELTGEDWETVLDAELRGDLREYIRTRITVGLDDPVDIVEYALNDFSEYDVDARLTAAAQAIVQQEIAVHQAEQANWPATTDCDRLDAAFGELETVGIVARQNFTCCNSCGVAEIGGDVAPDRIDYVRGYAFYHQQDTQGAIESGSLFVSYGTFSHDPAIEADPARTAAVGEEIAAALRRHDLTVDWDGDPDTRIHVALSWRRRR